LTEDSRHCKTIFLLFLTVSQAEDWRLSVHFWRKNRPYWLGASISSSFGCPQNVWSSGHQVLHTQWKLNRNFRIRKRV